MPKNKRYWEQAKGKLVMKWDQITQNELEYVRGKMRALIGRTLKRDGETDEAVEKAIEHATTEKGK